MDTKCHRVNCLCTHTDGCVKGYIETRYKVVEKRIRNNEPITIEKWYDGVKFCPVCDPVRAHIQETSRSSEEMADRLRALSPNKRAENYEKENEARTHTL